MRLWVFATIFLVLIVAGYLTARWWRFGGDRQILLSLPLQGWPDFRKWDQRSEFDLEEVAALWLDAEPQSPMWWRARRKLRHLRAAIAAMGQPQGLTGGVRLSTSQTPHPRVPRETLRAIAEREGVHPLFLYPEFRFRSQDRDRETDGTRLASIYESVRSAISNAENELGGLTARLENAGQSASRLLTTTGNRSDKGPKKNERANIEVRLFVPERRIEELRGHLTALRRIESAVNKELNS
jgi:hypothetical protein